MARNWDELRARDVMTSPVRVLERGLRLDQAIHVLAAEGVSGAPVVGARGQPIGVLSLFDVVSWLADLEGSLGKPGSFYSRTEWRFEGEEGPRYLNLEEEDDLLRTTRVEEVMTPEVHATAPEATLAEVAGQMAAKHVHRLLVMEGDKVRGVVSTMDLIRVMAEQAEPHEATRA